MSYRDRNGSNPAQGSAIEVGSHGGEITLELGVMRSFGSLSTDAWAALTPEEARELARRRPQAGGAGSRGARMIGRRSLLRLIGAAPLAAASAPTSAAEMAGLTRLAGLGTFVSTVTGGDPAPSSTDQEGDSAHTKAARYLLATGIPDFIKDEMRRRHRTPSGLDPDLAANRSFSLAAKVMLQRDRDFVRACETTMAQQRTSLARTALSKTLGFELWW